ncbi:exodeoxyribonuclease VII small subunit [Sediminitomix flava]|uniref:Exodeoxyribonuclease VII small subunit n=1 Tax=Sediminitomix flava TaxID=379075 RepID=A0A315Z588_SEDFL|nr:exodeoxyribonuclease VII small subunit [Sediminitomix flava]PWJ38628.1 exodeoxyribonuclease VII small subunit [Sediminitomix flava]
MKEDNNELSYEKALEELLSIQSLIQDNEIPIDQLEGKVKRANELIKYCQQKLRGIESKIDELFNDSEK